jgi:hypothetical protein
LRAEIAPHTSLAKNKINVGVSTAKGHKTDPRQKQDAFPKPLFRPRHVQKTHQRPIESALGSFVR